MFRLIILFRVNEGYNFRVQVNGTKEAVFKISVLYTIRLLFFSNCGSHMRHWSLKLFLVFTHSNFSINILQHCAEALA